MNNAQTLDNRTKGQFPVSIATSLAIEGLFGILEDNPISAEKAPINQYEQVVINFRTLFRNMLGSVPNESSSYLGAGDYAVGILEEITLLKNIVFDRTEGRVTVHVYAPTYKSLARLYPHASIKEARTDRQKFYAALENSTIEAALEKMGMNGSHFKPVDVTINSDPVRIVMLTNYPIDLLSVKGAKDVALVESHTGTVKRRIDWYTKLNNGKTLERIPFDRMTIQMFGDSGGMFSPYPGDFRRKMLEIAEKYKWTSTSTKDMMKQCITLSHEPLLLAAVTKMYV